MKKLPSIFREMMFSIYEEYLKSIKDNAPDEPENITITILFVKVKSIMLKIISGYMDSFGVADDTLERLRDAVVSYESPYAEINAQTIKEWEKGFEERRTNDR